MPREKQNGTCSVCGQEKPLFDVKNKICGSCAGKKGGGRPKALVKDPKKTPLPEKVRSTPSKDTARSPLENGSAVPSAVEKFLCDACDAPVRYGQRKCTKCGTWCDWRGTEVERDPEIVVCPECGAVCGFADDAPDRCPHCNQGG